MRGRESKLKGLEKLRAEGQRFKEEISSIRCSFCVSEESQGNHIEKSDIEQTDNIWDSSDSVTSSLNLSFRKLPNSRYDSPSSKHEIDQIDISRPLNIDSGSKHEIDILRPVSINFVQLSEEGKNKITCETGDRRFGKASHEESRRKVDEKTWEEELQEKADKKLGACGVRASNEVDKNLRQFKRCEGEGRPRMTATTLFTGNMGQVLVTCNGAAAALGLGSSSGFTLDGKCQKDKIIPVTGKGEQASVIQKCTLQCSIPNQLLLPESKQSQGVEAICKENAFPSTNISNQEAEEVNATGASSINLHVRNASIYFATSNNLQTKFSEMTFGSAEMDPDGSSGSHSSLDAIYKNDKRSSQPPSNSTPSPKKRKASVSVGIQAEAESHKSWLTTNHCNKMGTSTAMNKRLATKIKHIIQKLDEGQWDTNNVQDGKTCRTAHVEYMGMCDAQTYLENVVGELFSGDTNSKAKMSSVLFRRPQKEAFTQYEEKSIQNSPLANKNAIDGRIKHHKKSVADEACQVQDLSMTNEVATNTVQEPSQADGKGLVRFVRTGQMQKSALADGQKLNTLPRDVILLHPSDGDDIKTGPKAPFCRLPQIECEHLFPNESGGEARLSLDDNFLQNCRQKVQSILHGCRMLGRAGDKHPGTSEGLATTHKDVVQEATFKCRADAAASLADDICRLVDHKESKSSHDERTNTSYLPEFISQHTQMKLDNGQKIIKDNEIRLDLARKIVLKSVGENFDYDKMYQELKDLGDERMKIEHHQGWKQYLEIKDGQKVISRLKQGSEAKGFTERSHHKEPGNKRRRAMQPLSRKAKNNFILSSLEKLDPSIPIEKVEAVSYPPFLGPIARNRKLQSKRKTTISVENDKKTKEQVPSWVERMSSLKVKSACAQLGGKEKSHGLHAILKRKSVRPPDTFFKLCKSLNWVPETSEALAKKDSALFPRQRLPQKRGSHKDELLKEDSPVRKPQIKSKLKYLERIQERPEQEVPRYPAADPSHQTDMDLNNTDKKKHEKCMAIEDVCISSVELHQIGGSFTKEETVFLGSSAARPQEGSKALGKDLQEGLQLMDEMRLSTQKNLEDEIMKRTLLETVLENILADDQRETSITAIASNRERKLFKISSAKMEESSQTTPRKMEESSQTTPRKMEESSQTTPRNRENVLVTPKIKDKSYTGQSTAMQPSAAGERSIPPSVPPVFPVVLPVFVNMPNNVQDKPEAGTNVSSLQGKVIGTQTNVVSGLEKDTQVDLEVRVSLSSSSSSELLSTSSSPTTPSTPLSSPGHEARLAAALSPYYMLGKSNDMQAWKNNKSMSSNIDFSKSMELEKEDEQAIKLPQVSDFYLGKEQTLKIRQKGLHRETIDKGKSVMQSFPQESSVEKKEHKAMPSAHVVASPDGENLEEGTDIKGHLGTDVEGQVQIEDTKEERVFDGNAIISSSEHETSSGDVRSFDGEERILQLASGLFSRIQKEALHREGNA